MSVRPTRAQLGVHDVNATVSSRINIFPRTYLLATQADTQEMPNVDDYIAQKAAVYELQQHMANWERKVKLCCGACTQE